MSRFGPQFGKAVMLVAVVAASVGVTTCFLTSRTSPRTVNRDRPSDVTESLEGDQHLRRYRSSQDTLLELWALVRLPRSRSCIMVTAHGWHGALNDPDPDIGRGDYLHIEVDMRGRAFSDGRQDASGWELQDWIDAVEFAKREYADHISDPDCVYAEGGSGSGGNVYAIVGKYPDYFAAAVVHAGMSDYALLYEQDEIGEFIDEMEEQGWIGGSPETRAEAYRSRGGLTTVGNLLTPLHIDHGETDVRVTVAHARRYARAAAERGSEIRYLEWPNVGDRQHWTNMTGEQRDQLRRSVRSWLLAHDSPPVLPDSGAFTVAGFLKTRRFEVLLEDIDRIGSLRYEIADSAGPWRFVLTAPTSPGATLRVRWLRDGIPAVTTTPSTPAGVTQGREGWIRVDLSRITDSVEVVLR